MTNRTAASVAPTHPPDLVGPDDPRYAYLTSRGRGNRRFTARPDTFWAVRSTGDVVAAVQHAVDRDARLVVRSGGHCFEGFVDDPEVEAVIDMALLADVGFDPAMGAFVVEAGARLGDVYRQLFLGWGVTIPAGESPDVGAGGHILGGGYGFLCRLHGLAADHLYAVEVVVVDGSGTAHAVVATRADDDPNRDLWWAHTGGGGGNFGIVTRYWLRSPDVAVSADPAVMLPPAPSSVLRFSATWDWSQLDQAAFTRLVRNFGDWCERNSDATSPNAGLFATLHLHPRPVGAIQLDGLLLTGQPDDQARVIAFLDALEVGVDVVASRELQPTSWLDVALTGHGGETARLKIKDAFLRQGPNDRQIATLYRALTDAAPSAAFATVALDTYGGQVNRASEQTTASAQRDSVLRTWLLIAWGDPGEDDTHLAWARGVFGALFADTGGVPAPGTGTDGSFINHPDVDLADPSWNTSGIPWSTLYYKDNYPTLQQIKARWDPRNVFHHALSIQLPIAVTDPEST